MKRFIVIIVSCALCVLGRASEARAGEVELLAVQVRELRSLVQDLSLTVENQQREIAILKGQSPPPFKQGVQAATPVKSRQGRWNPDIGVVADTVATLDSPRTDAEGADRVSVRELELIISSPVDPYSRLDATSRSRISRQHRSRKPTTLISRFRGNSRRVPAVLSPTSEKRFPPTVTRSTPSTSRSSSRDISVSMDTISPVRI